MANRVTNVANFWETTLTATFGATDLTATVASTSGITSPCLLVIDPDVPASREVIYFDGTFTGTTLVTAALGNRYLSGSAAGSGLSHSSGAVVRSVPLRQHIDDINDRISAHAHGGGSDGAAPSHDDLVDVSADDHHAQSHAHNGIDSSGTVDHGNLAGLADDDHTQYLKADGTRAMTGALDMGAAAITNVGDVDGVDVSALKTAFDRLSQKFRLTKSSTQSIANGTTAFITWQTETEDASGWHAGTDNFVTVPYTGFYMFALLLDVDSAADISDVTLRVNSATPGSGGLEGLSSGTPVLDSNQTARYVFFAWLDASDEVRIEVADQGLVAGSMVLGVNTRFYGMFLG